MKPDDLAITEGQLNEVLEKCTELERRMSILESKIDCLSSKNDELRKTSHEGTTTTEAITVNVMNEPQLGSILQPYKTECEYCSPAQKRCQNQKAKYKWKGHYLNTYILSLGPKESVLKARITGPCKAHST